MSRMRSHPLALPAACALALMACGPGALRAEDAPTFQALLSTNRIHIGDLVDLRVTVHHPADTRIAWPAVAADKRVVVREQRDEPQSAPGVSTRQWNLTSFAVGVHPLWTGRLAIARSDGTMVPLDGDTPTLIVESVLAGPQAERQDIKGLASWPRDGRLMRALLAIVALLLVLLAAGWFWWTRQRRPTSPAAPPPALPHEIALRALRELQARGWMDGEHVVPFYVELSGIVRRYIEDRFGLRAPEQTTEEFIRAASTSRLLSLDHQQLVEDFLAQCDLVKFARHRPEQRDMETALAAARRLVEETMLAPSPAQPTGGPAP